MEKLPPKQPAFQIHVDEPDGACTKKQVQPTKCSTVDTSPLTLNPTVTRLRQPLATIDLPMDVSFGMCSRGVNLLTLFPVTRKAKLTLSFLILESPMDMSVVEEEKPPCVNEVTEYAAEIHAHLREMEVSRLS